MYIVEICLRLHLLEILEQLEELDELQLLLLEELRVHYVKLYCKVSNSCGGL